MEAIAGSGCGRGYSAGSGRYIIVHYGIPACIRSVHERGYWMKWDRKNLSCTFFDPLGKPLRLR